MSKKSISDMEQIQQNLERFLQEEIQKDAQEQPDEEAVSIQQQEEAAYHKKERPAKNRETRKTNPVQKEPERISGKPQRKRKKKKQVERKTGKQTVKKTVKQKKGRQKKGRQKEVSARNEEKPVKQGRMKRFLAVLCVLAAVFCVLWVFLVGYIYEKMEYRPSETLASQPVQEEGVTNILLIGSDSRTQGDEGRSDAMILLSVSKKTKTIHMTSLLRDMYVEIPGHDGNRLNAAYSFGGPELLIQTIKQNLDIEVNRYVVVNFQAFANLVDAAEGVELELSNEEVQWVNAYLNEYNMLRDMPIDTDYLDGALSGIIHLNGPQALAYSRNRYIGTDFGRTERQRKVLSEVIKKLPLAAVKNPLELIDGLFPNLTTNLTKSECLRLSLLAGKFLTYDLIQGSIPQEGTYQNASIRGMAVLEVDFEKNKEYLNRELYGE